MKKIYFAFGIALLVITACMIILVTRGVSLRMEPLIKPSPIDANYQNITFGLIHRLFPEFQTADYVIWGLKPYVPEESRIFELLQKEYAKQLGFAPKLLEIHEKTSPEEIHACTKPCWLILDKDKASELPLNPLLTSLRKSLGENYFSVTFLAFEPDVQVPEICENEHRLEFACVLPVSVREIRRKLKEPDIRYFFMRRYNEKDHFLFLERVP